MLTRTRLCLGTLISGEEMEPPICAPPLMNLMDDNDSLCIEFDEENEIMDDALTLPPPALPNCGYLTLEDEDGDEDGELAEEAGGAGAKHFVISTRVSTPRVLLTCSSSNASSVRSVSSIGSISSCGDMDNLGSFTDDDGGYSTRGHTHNHSISPGGRNAHSLRHHSCRNANSDPDSGTRFSFGAGAASASAAESYAHQQQRHRQRQSLFLRAQKPSASSVGADANAGDTNTNTNTDANAGNSSSGNLNDAIIPVYPKASISRESSVGSVNSFMSDTPNPSHFAGFSMSLSTSVGYNSPSGVASASEQQFTPSAEESTSPATPLLYGAYQCAQQSPYITPVDGSSAKGGARSRLRSCSFSSSMSVSSSYYDGASDLDSELESDYYPTTSLHASCSSTRGSSSPASFAHNHNVNANVNANAAMTVAVTAAVATNQNHNNSNSSAAFVEFDANSLSDSNHHHQITGIMNEHDSDSGSACAGRDGIIKTKNSCSFGLSHIHENVECQTAQKWNVVSIDDAKHVSEREHKETAALAAVHTAGTQTTPAITSTAETIAVTADPIAKNLEFSPDSTRNPFQSPSVLFLDVDGVLLTDTEQTSFHPQLLEIEKSEQQLLRTRAAHVCSDDVNRMRTVQTPKKHQPQKAQPRNQSQDLNDNVDDHHQPCVPCQRCSAKCRLKCACFWAARNLKFAPNAKLLMTQLCLYTNCDVVISSSWQFCNGVHIPYLYSFLEDCGWNRASNIHILVKLLNINKQMYETAPYCQSRACGIQSVVRKYAPYIKRYAVFDDLPLDSSKYVCVPNAQHFESVLSKLSEKYFESIHWRHQQRAQVLPGIKEYVKYALLLPNSLFSENSLRFGFDFQTLTIYVCDAIARACPLTFELSQSLSLIQSQSEKNNNKNNSSNNDSGSQIYTKIVSDLQTVIYQYCQQNFNFQGNPSIGAHFVRTNPKTAITVNDIQTAIQLLTIPPPRQQTPTPIQTQSVKQTAIQSTDCNNNSNNAQQQQTYLYRHTMYTQQPLSPIPQTTTASQSTN